MRPLQPLLTPQLNRGKSWSIEWYFLDPSGSRKRIRKSRFDGIDLNAIADLGEREVVATRLLAELKTRLLPAALDVKHTPFLAALDEAVALKRSNKRATNKSFGEVARWVGEFFQAKHWQHLRCNQVDASHFQAYFDYMIVQRRVRNSTHNTRKNNLRSLVGELVRRGYFPENFVSKIPDRPAADPIRRPLSESEFQIVAQYVKANDRALSLAFILLGVLAIRPGELRDLRCGDIDLRRGVVRFAADHSKNNRNSVVTIPEEVLPVLAAFGLDKWPAMHYVFGRAKGRHNALLEPAAGQIGVNTLSQRFRTAVQLLYREGKLRDVRGIQFYSLKDSLAIYLLDQGLDVESAMRHFRHSDLSIFQRYVKRLGVVNEKIRGLSVKGRV